MSSKQQFRRNHGPIANDPSRIDNPYMGKLEQFTPSDIGVEGDDISPNTAFLILGDDIEAFAEALQTVRDRLGRAPTPEEFDDLHTPDEEGRIALSMERLFGAGDIEQAKADLDILDTGFRATDHRLYYESWFDALVDADIDPQTNPQWRNVPISDDVGRQAGRLIQVYTGVEFGHHTSDTWDEQEAISNGIVSERDEGFVAAVEETEQYIAYRRTSPESIIRSAESDSLDPFHDDEYVVTQREGGIFVEPVTPMTDANWLHDLVFEAESEEQLTRWLDGLEAMAEPTEADTLQAIEPPEDPKHEAGISNVTSTHFWEQLVGRKVLKLELGIDGLYRPVEVARYDWKDPEQPDKGVTRRE